MIIGTIISQTQSSKAPWRIYNIGNNNPVKLMDYINVLEKTLGKSQNKLLLPQPSDVKDTYSNTNNLKAIQLQALNIN